MTMIERTEATKVLGAYWAGKLIPVNPMMIAEAAGIALRMSSARELEGASGWYRIENNKPVIQYNVNEPVTRQRFTVAHELGHHFLGHGERPRDTSSAFIDPYDAVEISANRFAAELLMPQFPIRKTIQDSLGTITVAKLAVLFGVSDPAMLYRLKNLGIVS